MATEHEHKIQKRITQYFSEKVRHSFPDFPMSDEEMQALALRYSLDEIFAMIRATMVNRPKKKH